MKAPDLVAWIGEDELGSGEVGLKQAQVPAGMIPIVAVIGHKEKISRQDIVEQLRQQAKTFGVTIRLVRYVAVEELIVLG